MKATLLILIIIAIAIGITIPLIKVASLKDNIAIIEIKGEISPESSFIGTKTIDPETILSFLEDANERKNVIGIILDINSPGGAAVSSKQIADAIKKSDKPIVAVINDVGASGAYRIASAADYIIIDPLSITGSIGVTSSYLEFSKFFEKYGVTYQRLVAGELKDTGSPFRGLTKKEKDILEKKIKDIQKYFFDEVVKNRGINKEHQERILTGEFFLGIESIELGLADEFGNIKDAEEKIKELANAKEAVAFRYKKELSLFELITSLTESFSFYLGQGISSNIYKEDTLLRT